MQKKKKKKKKKKAYGRTMQMIVENDKMRLEAREGGESRDIKAILPGYLVLKKPRKGH